MLVQWFAVLRNSNSIRLEKLETLDTRFDKLVTPLKLKLEKFIFLGLDMHSNSKFSSSKKIEFDEIRVCSSSRAYISKNTFFFVEKQFSFISDPQILNF